MSSVPTGVLVYFLVSTVVAVLSHALLRRYFIGCGVAATSSPFAFAFACLALADSPNTVDVKILVFFWAISLLIALVVGVPFFIYRSYARRRPKNGM